MNGGIGFYGKLPGAGDFVRRRLPSDFVDAWDRHFQRALETGRRELGERWTSAWRQGAAWRFVLPSQVCGNGAWCGLTGPAVDRLGRAFPMVLAAPCEGDVARILGNDPWFDALERVYRSAQHEAVSVETFDARVAALPSPRADASDLAPLWRGLPWDSGQWQLELPVGAAAGTLLGEVWRQLGMRSGPWCLWWTEGAARLLATRGLPRSHAALLETPPVRQVDAPGLLNELNVPDVFGFPNAPGLLDIPADEAGDAVIWRGAVDLPAVAPLSRVATETIRSEPITDAGAQFAHDTAQAAAAQFAHDMAQAAVGQFAPDTAQPAGSLLWLDGGRTLVLSADDGPYDTRRLAARGIRETMAMSAPDQVSQRDALLSLHARLRRAGHGAAGAATENGVAIVMRLDGMAAHLLRVGAAALWHWRRGRMYAPFVERAAGVGGEFDDLLFGDAWLDMPGIGTAGEPDWDEAALRLEAGDRLLLLVTRELAQLPRDCLAEALALPTCDDARVHLASRANLGPQAANWPLAVVEVRA
jgi:type VI secretion system protein ImpM